MRAYRRHIIALGLIFLSLLLPNQDRAQGSGPSIALIITERAAAYEKVSKVIEEEYEGQLTSYDMRNSNKKDDEIVAKINKQNPKLLIALGDKAADLAASKLTAYPTLIGMVLDMDRAAYMVPGIEGVGLQISPQSILTQLRFVAPTFNNIGVISSSNRFASLRNDIRTATREFGIQMTEILAASTDEVKDKLKEALPRVDALWLLPDPTIVDAKTFKMIVNESQKKKKPLVVFSENFVRAGALFSVSPDYQATGEQLILLANKMLAKEDVRPSQPYLSKFHYPIGTYSVLNTKTAKKIGLEVTKDQLAFINQLVKGK